MSQHDESQVPTQDTSTEQQDTVQEDTRLPIPEVPEALTNSTRRAARTIVSTVRESLEIMREVRPILLAFNDGEERVTKALDTADTEAARAYRQARAAKEAADQKARDDFAAAIRDFEEDRDKSLEENAAKLKEYEEPAKESVVSVIGDVPTAAEHAMARDDWNLAVRQIKSAKANSKSQLTLEWDIELPTLVSKSGSGSGSASSTDWRPRFSAVSVGDKALPVNSRGNVTVQAVMKALKIKEREHFMSTFNDALGGESISQERFGKMATGESFTCDFDVNGQRTQVTFTKADYSRTVTQSDGSVTTESSDDSEDDDDE